MPAAAFFAIIGGVCAITAIAAVVSRVNTKEALDDDLFI